MTSSQEAQQREQHAKHIAMNGTAISGVIERHRAGKNGFVIDDFGEHLVLNNNEAIMVVADGTQRVLDAWDVFRKSLHGLDPEHARRRLRQHALHALGLIRAETYGIHPMRLKLSACRQRRP